MSAAFIGLDLAKAVFQVHGVDVHGKVVVTQRLRRDAVLAFFANLAPCVVGMEACGCAGCGGAEAGVSWPAHCRSTPELDQVRAQFSACLPYRVAADMLEYLLPIDAGIDPETLRACTLKVGEDRCRWPPSWQPAA
jgi:hypothetical protein